MKNAPSILELLTGKILAWYEMIVTNIPNFVVAFIVIILFYIFAKITQKSIFKTFLGITKNNAVANLMQSFGFSLIIFIGLFVSLELLNLDKTVSSILAGAGVIGLALGFAFQEIASNFIAGILIAFRKPYQVGDTVEVEGFFGQVTNINLRTTSITTVENLEVIIPNKDMFTKPFTNYTTTPTRRISISVGVSYGDDLEKVEKITKEALQGATNQVPGTEIVILYDEFGSSSINLKALYWINYTTNAEFLFSRHDAIKRIKKAFDENNITIPFPIRTLDFGAKGGVKLSEMLKN